MREKHTTRKTRADKNMPCLFVRCAHCVRVCVCACVYVCFGRERAPRVLAELLNRAINTIRYSAVNLLFWIGTGCASVLKTHSSRDMTLSSQKIKYRYLSVSARKKLCCTSSCVVCSLATSLMPQ